MSRRLLATIAAVLGVVLGLWLGAVGATALLVRSFGRPPAVVELRLVGDGPDIEVLRRGERLRIVKPNDPDYGALARQVAPNRSR